MAVRRLLDLSDDVSVLRKLAEEDRRELLDQPLPPLSTSHAEQLDEFRKLPIEEAQAAYRDLPLEVSFYLIFEGWKEVARSPYDFSDLTEWLSFETWAPKDALLLLSGVSPSAAIVEWSYENFMGAEIKRPKIRAASDLDAIHDHYDYPTRDSWSDDIAALKKELRHRAETMSEAELSATNDQLKSLEQQRDAPELVRRETVLRHRSNILAALAAQWFSGDHDPERRYSPEHYIGWAEARGYRPDWYQWAVSSRLLEEHGAVYRPPFFDPDADDYPELLHIAVRAWEEARTYREGTPKQRIDQFLQERYPSLRTSTRELIAQVANWQRTGGRPKR